MDSPWEKALSSDCTSIPFSNKILSRRDVLYRSISTSSAAFRDDCCRLESCSSWCLMVASRCLMYSVRRSRNAITFALAQRARLSSSSFTTIEANEELSLTSLCSSVSHLPLLLGCIDRLASALPLLGRELHR